MSESRCSRTTRGGSDALGTIIAIAVASLVPGCLGHDCFAVGYYDGFNLDVDSGGVAGSYQIQIDADGELLLVDYAVAADNRVSCFEGCRDEQGNVLVQPHDLVARNFTGSFLSVGVFHLDEEAGPAELDVRIFRDQALVFAQHYVPSYVTSEPNGPGCGTSVFASASIMLAPH